MDSKLSEKIADLQVQQAWVRRALADKGVAPASSAPPQTPENGNGDGGRTRKRSNKRKVIMEVVSSEADRVWLPSEVRDHLLARGIDTTAAAVRVTLRRMGDDKELVRPEDGNGWMVADPGAHSNGLEADNTLVF